MPSSSPSSARPRRGPARAEAALLLVGCVLLAGFALLWSVEPTFSFAADPSTPAEVAQSHRRLVLVTWCAVVGGLLLVAHAVWRRLAVWATLLGITWLVCTVLAVLTLSATAPQPPAQRWTPPPGYCAEYSGGDSDCPGG